MSYWAHLFVTREFDSTTFVPVLIEHRVNENGICECRCCLLSGTMCESFIYLSRTFQKEDFSCHLCTDEYCRMNINQSEQCLWMYEMKSSCYQYQSYDKSSSTTFMNLRPILQ